ncbi:DNA repair protein RadA [Vitis vinifera]|uniref:DNA repair protein RadA n=1 Tax=Vitis vinifera TaxID=29760 RepID=A0A438EW94_VITVI|nr:DNA repair protein RadA [Vitis vinifera]
MQTCELSQHSTPEDTSSVQKNTYPYLPLLSSPSNLTKTPTFPAISVAPTTGAAKNQRALTLILRVSGAVQAHLMEKPIQADLELGLCSIRKAVSTVTYKNLSRKVQLKGARFRKKGLRECGEGEIGWECNKVGTMKQFSEGESGIGGSRASGFEVSENMVRSWLPQQPTETQPQRLTDVNRGINQLNWRIPLHGPFGSEVARVLGGGLVPGSLVLVGGDPGAGKSTLLLQIAAIIAEGHDDRSSPVVYVSGEESVEQIGNRADRMRIETEDLFLYSSTDIEDILGQVHHLSPRALVVDSIQTVYLKGVTGSAGGLLQVKECTSALLRFAKKTNIPVFLIGHVTKSGDIAGPRVLEHIVDVVLYIEVVYLIFLMRFIYHITFYIAPQGEKHSSHRLLRSVKNRFGSTDELGVFEMTQLGLQVVSNPSELFLSERNSDSEILAGLAVAVIMDGSRSFLLEIQALCLSGIIFARQVKGVPVPVRRAEMIIPVSNYSHAVKFFGIFVSYYYFTIRMLSSSFHRSTIPPMHVEFSLSWLDRIGDSFIQGQVSEESFRLKQGAYVLTLQHRDGRNRENEAATPLVAFQQFVSMKRPFFNIELNIQNIIFLSFPQNSQQPIEVLMKQAGLKLQENGIFLNVVSGVTLAETAGDVAVAAAICSRHVLYHLISHHLLFLEFPIPNGIAFIGEIGLGGELRTVPRIEKRVNTVAKLGYKKCIVPKAAEKSLPTLEDMNIEIVSCRNLKEVISTVFV